MSLLAQYLDQDYEQTQARIFQVMGLLRELARMFRESRHRDRSDWPYSWDPTNRDDERHFPADKGGRAEISLSTQAMCCIAICHLLLADDDYPFLDADKDDLRTLLEVHLSTTITALVARLKTPDWVSSTYGPNDVFTAAWLLMLCDLAPSVVSTAPEWPKDFKPRMLKIVAEAITDRATHRPHVDRTVFLPQTNEAGPHALPLLKIVKSISIAQKDDLNSIWPDECPRPDELISAAGEWFEKNLHRQMSFYQFSDFRFDAAEMIFCLAGAMETRTIDLKDTIVPHVYEIVQQAQKRSVYWRPYRPMLLDPQGKVLLPLSVEVAAMLLETLDRTETFHQHRETLEEYFKWLASQKLEYIRNGVNAGWHSENAYETNRIHVWGSSLIATFLTKYIRALDTDIQREIKRASKLTVRAPDTLPHKLDGLVQFDLGLAPRPNRSFPLLQRDFLLQGVKKRDTYSLLLYGPPGASKTTLAQALAKELKWDLVYLSPSDFITGGEAGIEERAKTLFRALSALKHCVIFFDEIDRMILDRRSKAYGRQGDMFQFMTPGMLVKFNDLRKEKLSVFIISTNFAERIDDAIKREGRIDCALLCLPFDWAARTEQLRRLIDEGYLSLQPKEGLERPKPDKWPAERLEKLKEFASKLPLCVYEELARIVRQAIRAASFMNDHGSFCEMTIAEMNKSDLYPGQISLESYPDRIADQDYRQKPYEEYLSQILLQAESQPTAELRKEFRNRLREWANKSPNEYKMKHNKIEENARAYGLSEWVELTANKRRPKERSDAK